MGFYIRKALKVGPLRFNLSSSGIGVSGGITGLRLGTGPRGNYIHMGRGGLYFRRSLNGEGRARRTSDGPHKSAPTPEAVVEAGETTVTSIVDIESRSVLEMADSSSTELLRELSEKQHLTRLFPLAVVGLIALLILIAGLGAPPWSIWTVAVLGVPCCWWAAQKDTLRRTTVILYDLEDEAEQDYSVLHDAFQGLRESSKLWHIAGSGRVLDTKYHAGASSVVRRSETFVTVGDPPLVRSNIQIPLLPVGRQTMAFLPDRLLVFDQGSVGAISYDDLKIRVSSTRFVEEEGLPSDAKVVDRTWRYVNRKGGPDLRFRDNPELPVCLYEELHFSSSSGLNEVVQLSRSGAGKALFSALQTLRSRSRQIGDQSA